MSTDPRASSYPLRANQLRTTVDPDKPFIAGTTSFSYGELFDRMDRLKVYYEVLGLAPGSRVLIASRHDAEVAALFLSLVTVGLAAVIVDPRATAGELNNMLVAARPAAAFVDTEIAGNVEFPAGLHVVTIAGGGSYAGVPKSLTEPSDTMSPQAVIDEEDTALILFTSGTTARPKGVELTHRNLLANLATFERNYGYGPDCRILNHLPLHHTDGLTHGVAIAFHCEMTMVRFDGLTIQNLPGMLAMIETERITTLITVPAALTMALRLGSEFDACFQSPDFRFVRCSAGTLDDVVWSDFEDRFDVPVVNAYGLTESTCEACYCGPRPDTRRFGTIGKPVDCEARVVDADGRTLSAGNEGELVLRGDNVMKGYFDDPQSTAKVIRDGWLHTGDIVVADDQGFLRFVGRRKAVVIRGGLNVEPEDITRVLRDLSGIRDAFTVGLPDDTWGERVVACVSIDGSIDWLPEELLDYCRDHLGPERMPDDVHTLDALPYAPSGRIDIEAMKQTAARLSGVSDLSAALTIEQRFFAIASRVLNDPSNDLNAQSNAENSMGWDSFAHMILLGEIEAQFGVEFDTEDILRLKSLGEIFEYVTQHQPRG